MSIYKCTDTFIFFFLLGLRCNAMDGTVLLLDYSSYERQKIRHILEKAGRFEVIEAGDIRQFRLLDLDIMDLKLIIMDLAFPSESDGLDVLRKIRASAAGSTPVIIITQADKPELKAEAVKLSVRDYIKKPYQVKRLEASIKSIVRTKTDFYYDTGLIDDIVMPFDSYIDREIKFAKRTGTPLSLVLITTLQLDNSQDPERTVSASSRASVYAAAVKTAKEALRSTDTIALNGDRDIIIVLPCTDEAGAQLVCEKIINLLEPEFRKLSIDKNMYIYPVYVTLPRDGESFQQLMQKAFKKVSDKEMLEKIVSIPTDTRNYANRSYSRHRWWM